jgi:hypothetical protein
VGFGINLSRAGSQYPTASANPPHSNSRHHYSSPPPPNTASSSSLTATLGDDKNFKAAVQRAGLRVQDALKPLAHSPSQPSSVQSGGGGTYYSSASLPPSSSGGSSNRNWLLIASAAVGTVLLVVLVVVLLIVSPGGSSRGGGASTTTAAIDSASAAKRRPVFVPSTEFANLTCGFGTRQHSGGTRGYGCEPDYAALIDAVRLDEKRRGQCSPPASLSHWVCDEYLADASNQRRRIVDDYLSVRADYWLSYMQGKSPLLRAAESCTLHEPSPLIEHLRRKILAADSWRTLARHLGALSAIDSKHLLGFGGGGGDCASLLFPAAQREDMRSVFLLGEQETQRELLSIEQQQQQNNNTASATESCRFVPETHAVSSLEDAKKYYATRLASPAVTTDAERSAPDVSLFVQALVIRDLRQPGGPLDPEGQAARYLYQTFEQLRTAFLEAIRSSNVLSEDEKNDLTVQVIRMRVFLPPFDALDWVDSVISKALDGGRKQRSCADLHWMIRAAWTAAEQRFSTTQLHLAGVSVFPGREHQPEQFQSVRYQSPPLDAILVGPLALTAALYHPLATSSAAVDAVDVYGRLGWRMAREMALAIGRSEGAAFCVLYRVLCTQQQQQGSVVVVTANDIAWMRRLFWDVAATHCGDSEASVRIDQATRDLPLYRVTFACNGLFLYKNNLTDVIQECFGAVPAPLAAS